MKLERRLPPFYALFFYAFPAIVAWIWLYHAHPGRSAELWSFESALLGIPLGLAAGLLVVGLTLLASRTCAWARRLESEFGWILGAQKLWGIIWISLLSGFAEEYLFRGALFPWQQQPRRPERGLERQAGRAGHGFHAWHRADLVEQ